MNHSFLLNRSPKEIIKMAEDASASAAAAVVSVCRKSFNTSAGRRAGRPQKDSLFTQPRVEKQTARASD